MGFVETNQSSTQRRVGLVRRKETSAVPTLHGFSLVELLVVVSIVAILASILLPTIAAARQNARTAKCLSNLRQMVIAAHTYAGTNHGSYPIGYYYQVTPTFIAYEWDFITTKEASGIKIEPGLLWENKGPTAIQQCPSFEGSSNSFSDPYTGYNYNVSFIGHGSGETIVNPAKMNDVRNPARCALFGDGQYSAGANKFMRSPFAAPGDLFPNRSAGTQGYRHRGQTNVAFCDGHAETRRERYTETYPIEKANITPGTGFLSADNAMYDIH
jgi:prepilin-type N-terminal cleavage/methylation domain-containing protein/prepilin-type processing-associated H-X9-DG protein